MLDGLQCEGFLTFSPEERPRGHSDPTRRAEDSPRGDVSSGGSGNEGGIDDRALLHEVPFSLEQGVHNLQELFLEFMLLQEVTEVEDRRLVGDGVTEQIDPEELLEGAAVVDGLFHRGIGEIIPLLEEVDLQHELHVLCRAAHLVIEVVGTDGSEHVLPGDDAIHLVEEPLAAEFLLVGNREEGGLGGHGKWGKRMRKT